MTHKTVNLTVIIDELTGNDGEVLTTFRFFNNNGVIVGAVSCSKMRIDYSLDKFTDEMTKEFITDFAHGVEKLYYYN